MGESPRFESSPGPNLPSRSSSFTIHGLWPEYKTGGWPQFCGAHTTHQAAGPPTPAQNCLWPSLIGPSPGFWEHEWAKHGTCAAPLLGNRTAFVATVLELHEKYNLDVSGAGRGGVELLSGRLFLLLVPRDIRGSCIV